MASTYGWLWGKAQHAGTRCGGREGITSKVATWNGAVIVDLKPNGNAEISITGDINAIITDDLDRRTIIAKPTKEEIQKDMLEFDKSLEQLSKLRQVIEEVKE